MSDDELKLHIVVNDEIIDLRKENLERKPKNRSPYRTISQQVISNPSRSGLFNSITERNRARQNLMLRDSDISTNVNGLKKLATNLCYGPSPIMQRNNKNVASRTKLRNRATSADPRFRRERSPVSTQAAFTHSDSQVLELPLSESKKTKTQSDPTFLVRNRQLQQHQQQQKKKSAPLKSTAHSGGESKNESSRNGSNISSFPANTFVLESSEEMLKGDASKKEDDKSSSLRCSASQNLSNETLVPSIVEQSTMTDEITGTNTFPECKSLYQTAVTDLRYGPPKNTDLDVYNSMGDPCFEKPGQISPYWDDPRLIEKYSKLLRPVQIRKSKSSWTLPLAINKQVAQTSAIRICPKCTCTTTTTTAECNNEVKDGYTTCNTSELTEATVTYEKTKTKLYNAMFKNYYLTAFFLMGSLCGLMLVAFVVWVLANDLLWTYLNRGPETQKYTGFRWLTAYIGGGVLYTINFVFSKLYHMIVMPRNEVFDPTRSEGTWSIWF